MKSKYEHLLRGGTLLFAQNGPIPDLDLRDDLRRIGVDIAGPAGGAADVRRLLAEPRRIDGAVLDLDLDGREAVQIADLLIERGIPFVFAVNDPQLVRREQYPGFVLCRKPIHLDEIADALFGGMSPRGSA